MLDLLVHDAPLYIYARDFEDYPEMHHQLEVIKALKAGDEETAKRSWEKLSQYNSSLYLERFEHHGDKTLFFQALDLYKKILRQKKFHQKN